MAIRTDKESTAEPGGTLARTTDEEPPCRPDRRAQDLEHDAARRSSLERIRHAEPSTRDRGRSTTASARGPQPRCPLRRRSGPLRRRRSRADVRRAHVAAAQTARTADRRRREMAGTRASDAQFGGRHRLNRLKRRPQSSDTSHPGDDRRSTSQRRTQAGCRARAPRNANRNRNRRSAARDPSSANRENTPKQDRRTSRTRTARGPERRTGASRPRSRAAAPTDDTRRDRSDEHAAPTTASTPQHEPRPSRSLKRPNRYAGSTRPTADSTGPGPERPPGPRRPMNARGAASAAATRRNGTARHPGMQ